MKGEKSLKDEGAGESICNRCQERKTTKYLWDMGHANQTHLRIWTLKNMMAKVMQWVMWRI